MSYHQNRTTHVLFCTFVNGNVEEQRRGYDCTFRSMEGTNTVLETAPRTVSKINGNF